jgi:hypothetical protein
MHYKGKINDCHTAPQTVLRNIKSPYAAKALRELIKEGLVTPHPTSYGKEISLNINRIQEIEELIKPLYE